MSLIGIILIQISWLRNMLLLREDQVSQKLLDVTRTVGEQLAQYKGTAVAPKKAPAPFGGDFSLELSRPYSIGQRFTAQELHEKIRKEFLAYNLENIPFEFGLATIRTGEIGYMERQSPNFAAWYDDTTNHLRYHHFLTPPSGSAAENLAADEMLIIVVPSIKNIV